MNMDARRFNSEHEFKDYVVSQLNIDPMFIVREARTTDFSGACQMFIDIWFDMGGRIQILESKMDPGIHTFTQALGQCIAYRHMMQSVGDCDCYIVRPRRDAHPATMQLQSDIAKSQSVELLWGDEVRAHFDSKAAAMGLTVTEADGFTYRLRKAA